MSEPRVDRDARVLRLLALHLPGPRREGPTPLGIAEWQRIGARLRQAGLSRPGELLEVGAAFWSADGLEAGEIARLQGLLERGDLIEQELERLAGLGIWTVARGEPGYPARLRARLHGQAPLVMFGAGDGALAERGGLAIAGSRDVDGPGAAFTRAVAVRCARDGMAVVTGGAKGVDQIAMETALEAGGSAVGVVAGNLERAVRPLAARRWLEEGRLLLLSPSHPKTGFTAGNAMARNKLVYALADYGLVVASTFGQGGTWTGAREVLRRGWVPLFVRDDPQAPEGNRELLRPAARPFPPLEQLGDATLVDWLARQAATEWPPEVLATNAGETSRDLFPLVWPILSCYLEMPRSEAEISSAFRLAPEQTRAWIERTLAEGKVAEVSGPVPRYRCARLPPLLPSRVREPRSHYQTTAENEDDPFGFTPGFWPEGDFD